MSSQVVKLKKKSYGETYKNKYGKQNGLLAIWHPAANALLIMKFEQNSGSLTIPEEEKKDNERGKERSRKLLKTRDGTEYEYSLSHYQQILIQKQTAARFVLFVCLFFVYLFFFRTGIV